MLAHLKTQNSEPAEVPGMGIRNGIPTRTSTYQIFAQKFRVETESIPSYSAQSEKLEQRWMATKIYSSFIAILNDAHCEMVSRGFQSSKCRNADVQPQIQSIWFLFPNDRKFCQESAILTEKAQNL